MTSLNKDLLLQIKKVVQLLQQMLDISMLQKQFAEARRWEEKGMDEFNRLLAARQTLIEQIDKIMIREIDLTAPENQKNASSFQKQKEKCLSIVRQIESNDQITREALEKNADQTAVNLAGVKESRKINKAYAGSGIESAWFFDMRK